VRALRAERVQLTIGLQNQHPLTAYWNDDKLILLKLGYFITGQMRRAGRTRLRQRLEITNDWIDDAGQPTERGRTQKKIEKMAARRC
jgi:hypothetical protein